MSDALSTLTAEGAQVVSRCEVWLDGVLAEVAPVIDGQVVYDTSSRVLRSCDVRLAGTIPAGPSDPLAPIGSELRLFRGARDWTGEVLEEPLGRYAFGETDVDRAERTVAVSGYDYAQLVTEARWEVPFVIEPGTNVADAVATAVQSRLPPLLWREPNLETTTATVPGHVVLGEEVDNDPWSDVAALAASDGLEVSFDRAGRLTLSAVPDPDAASPRWTYAAGTSPTYLSGGKRLTGRPYNVVVARGETEGDTPPVSAVAEDDNPTSPSYIGRYRRPYFLASSYIATAGQAQRAADGQLRRLIGLAEVIELSVIPHPGLDVWQVLEAFDPVLAIDARYVVDRVELPLRPGRATLSTRRRRL